MGEERGRRCGLRRIFLWWNLDCTSSYPTMKSFGFLKKLKLKSILTLVVEEYPEKNLEFIKKSESS